MVSLSDVRKTQSNEPPRFLVLGQEKTGKTTLANEFPNPIFIQTETGGGLLSLTSFGHLSTFKDIMDALRALYKEDHDYKTLVIDSLSSLQAIVWTETGERGDEKGQKHKSIESFGYSKGYVWALSVWQEMMDAINILRLKKKMMVVYIAHTKVEQFDDPESKPYSRYDLDLEVRARELFKRDSDAILFLKSEVATKTEDKMLGERNVFIYTQSRPAWVAGNRYNLPDRIPFELGKGFKTIAPYLPNV